MWGLGVIFGEKLEIPAIVRGTSPWVVDRVRVQGFKDFDLGVGTYTNLLLRKYISSSAILLLVIKDPLFDSLMWGWSDKLVANLVFYWFVLIENSRQSITPPIGQESRNIEKKVKIVWFTELSLTIELLYFWFVLIENTSLRMILVMFINAQSFYRITSLPFAWNIGPGQRDE